MPEDQPAELDPQQLASELAKGVELRERGNTAALLEHWDGFLRRTAEVDGVELRLARATALYDKAHILQSLGRAREAVVAAEKSAELVADMPELDRRLIGAHALGVARSAWTSLDQNESALAVDEKLVAAHQFSEAFELRHCAGQALRHQIWTYGHLGKESDAVAAAERLIELFKDDDAPEHLVQITELFLSAAEALNHRRIWQRTPPAVSDEARALCDAAIRLAERTGGRLGEAVKISARITAADALVRQRRIFASYKDRLGRPSPDLETLPALAQVATEAREAGSEGRYISLVMLRATTLRDAHQRAEALTTVDELLAYVNTEGRTAQKRATAAIKAMRRALASERFN